jgi:haloalkane dehalogenase
MPVLRSPEFEVAGFDYPTHYLTVGDGLRMAYVTDGPSDGDPVVLLHGEPTWSYLWRSVIPVLANAGFHVIAPDLIGFGRSDKPTELSDHSYAAHVEWVRAFAFDALDLTDVTVVGHDWGGLIGLRLATEHTHRFARFVATNTGLPTGDQEMPEAWLRFRDTVRRTPDLDVARLVRAGCRTPLSDEAAAAYAAPFGDPALLSGPRAMPGLVPTTPEDPASEANRLAWQRLQHWDRPFLVAFSDADPITSPMAPVFAQVIPGARTATIEGAGHFLQEDAPKPLAQAIVEFLSPAPG